MFTRRELAPVLAVMHITTRSSGNGGSERHYIGVGVEARNYICNFEGSQALPPSPSARGSVYGRS
jgi:hypothetical protein